MRRHVVLVRAANLVANACCVFLRYPVGLVLRILGKKTSGKCVVLYYHAVRPNQLKAFERQVEKLMRVARPITAAEYTSLEPGSRYFAITFDDAFASVLAGAIPILVAHKIPCIVFVPTGYLGRSPGWEHEQYFPDANEVVATAEQLLQLPTDLVTIGSHTVMHSDLVNRPNEVVERELRESKEQLEALLGRDIRLLAFPYGHLTPSLVNSARTVGYQRVFGTEPGACCLGPKCFVVGRVNADPSDGIWQFHFKILGAFCQIPAMTIMKNKIKSLMGLSNPFQTEQPADSVLNDHD